MFLFQVGTQAKGTGTANAGKTLSTQEFSKKVDQLYVRTEVSYRQVIRSIGELDFGDRLLNRDWLEILEMGTISGAGMPGKKEMDVYASARVYQVAFRDFQKKYNALKGALRAKDDVKVQSALSELSNSYFELCVAQAKLVQKLEEFDLKGFEYAMPVLEKAMDVGIVVGLVSGVGAVASLGRAALAATLKQFLRRGTKRAVANAFAGAAFFSAMNFGMEYYSFGQLSGAMKRMETDQLGALDELSGILHGVVKKTSDGGGNEGIGMLALAVDLARVELRLKLKEDPSYRLNAGSVAAYFGETFAQLVVFEMGFGFFRAAAPKKTASPQTKKESNLQFFTSEPAKQEGVAYSGIPVFSMRKSPSIARRKLFVVDACFVIDKIATGRDLRQVFKEMKEASNGGEIIIPEQVFSELERQSLNRRRHGTNNVYGADPDDFIVPPAKLQELRIAIFSDQSLAMESAPITEVISIEAGNILRAGSDKGNSRVGEGELGIFGFLREFGALYRNGGYDICVLSKDSDVPYLVRALNDKDKLPVSVSF
jgi:hypothetical protein